VFAVVPTLHYRIVNVFAESPLAGNPLCVFEDGSALDGAMMQALALQFNLSETTFILPATTAGATAHERCQPNAELLMRYSIGNNRNGLAYVWARVDAATIRVRFFFTKYGSVIEDPGTGSACANLGGWFIAQGEPLPLAAKVLQGDQVGRPCRLGLTVDAEKNIFVSGRVIALGRGELNV